MHPSIRWQEGPSAALTVSCFVTPGALQRALQRAGSLAGAGGAAVLQADVISAQAAAEQDAAVPGAEPGHTAGVTGFNQLLGDLQFSSWCAVGNSWVYGVCACQGMIP
jgi:hypothetical protein